MLAICDSMVANLLMTSMDKLYRAGANARHNKSKFALFSERVEETRELVLRAARAASLSRDRKATLTSLSKLYEEVEQFMSSFGKRWYVERMLAHKSDDHEMDAFNRRLNELLQQLQIDMSAQLARHLASKCDTDAVLKALEGRADRLSSRAPAQAPAPGHSRSRSSSAYFRPDGRPDQVRPEQQIQKAAASEPYVFDGKPKQAALLGVGAAGKTYRMKGKVDGVLVAVKMFNEEHAAQLGVTMEKVLHESRMLMALRHRHIVAYRCMYERHYESDSDTVHECCMAMEFAPGGTLKEKIKRGRRLPEETVRKWMLQLCSALHHMHRDCRMLHRDLKPGNILLSAENDVKICDLGLACIVDSSVSNKSSLAGTGMYMSPEKAHGERYDEKDDMWALGCILAELVTLRPTAEYHRIGLWVAQEKVPQVVAAVQAEYGGRFAEPVRQLLLPEPEERPSAGQLVELLELAPRAAPPPGPRVVRAAARVPARAPAPVPAP
eukprot:g7247.t1